MARNYVQESQDVEGHRYHYDFDTVLRGYMMQTFTPLQPKGKALELGCYKGEFTALIARHYGSVTVVEAAENCIADARARVGDAATFIHSTFERASLKPEYDAIFLIHTLEHLDDPIAVLKKINTWLAPEGKLFLAVPNANAPSRQIAVKMGLISHNAAVTEAEAKHGHRCTYSLDTLERDARAGGLSILSRGGVFFKPLANYQFDKLMGTDIISQGYLDGCYQLGQHYPDLCASVYVVCGRGA